MDMTLTLSGPDLVQLIDYEIDRDPRLRSTHTRRGYRHDLAHFETWRAGRLLTKLLVEEYARHLHDAGRAPAAINRALAAIRWWARKLADLAFEDPNVSRSRRDEITLQASRVAQVGDVRAPAGVPVGRHVPAGELDALMRACANDPTTAGARDAALIALGAATGARRFELAGLRLDDWSTASDGGAVMIRGKGGKDRALPVYGGALAAVEAWLDVRGRAAGPLFCQVNKGGRVSIGDHLTTQALADVLTKRCTQAGIVKPMTWHDLRRTLAGDLLDAGADVVTVGKVLGHSNPSTTAKYDRRPEETRRRALRGRHVPYYGRGLGLE